MQLKNFQEEAITELKRKFYKLWKGGNRRARLVFKAPTGSGKTIMMAELLKRISGDMQFEVDKAFVWISFNEDSYEQSKTKLFTYYNKGVANLNLLDLSDMSRGHLKQNDVFFVNWQKVVSKSKENRRLRQSGEQNISFDEFIEETKTQGREIVLIVDEAHISTHTELSQEIIDLLDPRIMIHVSATPRNIPDAEQMDALQAAFVGVPRDKVVEEGLIKETIEIMPLEEIEKIEAQKGGKDLDHLLLDLAIEKKAQLEKHFKKLGVKINPLVLIQLPNDEKVKKELQENKLEVVRQYLKARGYADHDLAIWLSNKKENLKEITRPDSPINFLIFKQAAATGWDCPRAQVLVMFREIKTPVFRIQVLGRILRIPEARHYPIPDLNKAHLYTNYERNQIEGKEIGGNKPALKKSFRDQTKQNVELPSVFFKRVSYGDLGDSFQKTFVEVANRYFGLKGNEIMGEAQKKLKAKGLETENIKFTNELIINSTINSYDQFKEQLEKDKEMLKHEASRHDIEKTYNLYLFREIKIQDEEKKKFAPERSWSKLKTAINVWLKGFSFSNPLLYTMVAYDLQKEDQSVLRKVISEALGVYKPIRLREENERAQRSRENLTFTIRDTYSFTDDFEEKPVKKSIVKPFYIPKNYPGKKNEEDFIEFLEKSENVDWWFKNHDFGKEFLAIPYKDETGALRRFYADFIVRTKDGRVAILDPKSGQTATAAKEKAEALFKYISKQNKKGKKLWGGIVIKSGSVWKINRKKKYSYNPKDLGAWEDLTL